MIKLHIELAIKSLEEKLDRAYRGLGRVENSLTHNLSPERKKTLREILKKKEARIDEIESAIKYFEELRDNE